LAAENHVIGVGCLNRLHTLVNIEAVGIDLVARRGEVVLFAILLDIRHPVEIQADTRLVPRDLLRRGQGNIRAAVLRETGYPLRIESLELEGPRQDEVPVGWWPSPRSHGR
jgi:hypothetical protein